MERLYSVDRVADLLGLHVRTVRGYVRDGRLKAVRIGKQYRIAHEDLEVFTGRSVSTPTPETAARQRHVEVSSIVEVEAISVDTASRVSTLLTGVAVHRGDAPVRIETVYDEERARMKIVVLADIDDTVRLLEYVKAVLES
ncbi:MULTISPECIES: helix-turn-helix domain-containing protein [unclassified Pseudofrankia]|uniref:helix-turn-helix domain-containing protein n=1 Tax=unclassified Pseudofrankia TaxID=2994372 RepID=UPI0008DAF0D5|nr:MULTISPECIES: helix-turn-helix domain-containing protein [unclassified Pseudofrankia]MDT3440653.1 helix-turn-helix domain-containing protein [Pseudofrankia sp. BMG5.37]OHV60580.1 MerR family transcriptional regulator [Pseudofrankia sp. BMG5.36]